MNAQLLIIASVIAYLCKEHNYVIGETGISPETQAACNGGTVITRPRGLILSPNFPRIYDSNSSCNWTLIAPSRHMIVLKFFIFHLEDSASCTFDSVKIYHAGMLFTGVGYCGRVAPRDFSSVSNMIIIMFKSDHSTNEGGFLIGWRFEESCQAGEFSCWSGYCISKHQQCDSEIDCPDGSDEIECAHASETDFEECGVQAESPRFPWNPLPSQRVVFGSTAAQGSWPWQARMRRSNDYRGVCGASVINPLVLLTAAHCVDENKRPTDFLIQVGNLNLSEPNWRQKLYQLKTFVLHPRYTLRFYRNDIAVLILKKRLVYTNYIRPICLIEMEGRDSEFIHPERCVVTGYGDIDHTSGKIYPDDIFQVRLDVFNQEACKASYDTINIPVTEMQVCAGAGFGDACQGDSGGPFACLHRNNFRWYLIGATSFGVQCSDNRFPGVYTRVSAYHKWIKTEIRWAEACSDIHYLNGMNKTSTSGTITSPNYPGSYMHNLKCTWTMLLKRNRVVKIEFARFSLGDICFRSSGDSLTIFNDGKKALQVCGSRSPEYMMSDASNVTIQFRTDDSFTSSGFMLNWKIMKTQDVEKPSAVMGSVDHEYRMSYELYERAYSDIETIEHKKLSSGSKRLKNTKYLLLLLVFLLI